MKKRFFRANLNDTQKAFYKIKLYEMILALVFVLFGCILLINKVIPKKTIAIALGLLILINGAINIYSNFMPNNDGEYKREFIFGILYCIVALLLFTNIIKFVNYVQIYYSIYLALLGINELITAIRLKMMGDKSFLLVLFMSILVIALGGLLLFYPYVSFTIYELYAIFSILFGLLRLNACNLLKNRAEEIVE